MKLLVVLALTLADVAFAENALTVTKVNSSHTKVIVAGSGSGDLKPGDVLVYTDEFGQSCQGQVLKSRGAAKVVDISKCEDPKIVQVGAVMTPGEADSALVSPPEAPAQAQFESKRTNPRTTDLRSENESWYTLWGLGLARPQYPGELQDAVDFLEDLSGVDRSTFAYDFLGFYWPTADHKSMYGVIVNVVSDSFEGAGGELTLLQYTVAASYQKFFGTNIGDGWFLRGDAGIAWYHVTLDTSVIDMEESSEKGFGLLFGGGYSFVIGTDTRMPLGLYFAHRSAESDDMFTTSLMLSFLF